MQEILKKRLNFSSNTAPIEAVIEEGTALPTNDEQELERERDKGYAWEEEQRVEGFVLLQAYVQWHASFAEHAKWSATSKHTKTSTFKPKSRFRLYLRKKLFKMENKRVF